FFFFFFFQAEDGIRDFHVTGVQTCALPISANARINENYFSYKMNELRQRFYAIDPKDRQPNLTGEQLLLVEEMRSLTKDALPPSQRLEHGMHSFVAFIVMPVFALCNAAIPISFDS